MKILLLGFGHVGRKLAACLSSERQHLPGLRHLDATVVGIVTRRHGSVVNASGISLEGAIAHYAAQGQFDASFPGFSTVEAQTAVDSLEYDVLLELTTLSITDQGEPAASYIRGALHRKKHVVCANKGPIAFAYQELRSLAERSGCWLLFESAVLDGAPVFSLARSSLLGCNVSAVSGILNSTTTFVLSQMEQGRPMDEAVARAQHEGFAEADPSHDLDGWDAAAKICVLWNVLGNGSLTPHQVERQGLSDLRPEAPRDALARSQRLKLVARAWKEGDRDRAMVRLEEFPRDHPFATVSGTGSILKIETDCMNPILIMQESPSILDTAYGVLNDCLTISSS
jgi:homoserine dehydrogenase